LLMSLPGINGAFADYILDTLGIEHTRRIRGLGRNQLAALIAEFAPDKRRG
jgi:ribosomal protein S13